MTVIDELLAANDTYARGFEGSLPLPPSRRVAVVACMDARLDVSRVLGLAEGDAHVIRNAGGVVTDDVLRSLATSQRLLGTRAIVLVHHTDCGMLTFTDQAFRDDLEQETGSRPGWASAAFTDLDADVRTGMGRIVADPYVPHTDSIRGFVFDVSTGRLREVDA